MANQEVIVMTKYLKILQVSENISNSVKQLLIAKKTRDLYQIITDSLLKNETEIGSDYWGNNSYEMIDSFIKDGCIGFRIATLPNTQMPYWFEQLVFFNKKLYDYDLHYSRNDLFVTDDVNTIVTVHKIILSEPKPHE